VKPLIELVAWLFQAQRMMAVLLGAVVMLSAFGVIVASHETRGMYREIQVLQKENDDLQSEYEKLLLEQSAWANNSRVDEIARNKLQMVPPDVHEIVMVRNFP
jgi:cell division protein FtsL